ncbi:MAG: hypothetical protein PHD97_12010 [Bacteroidales bacterium]|nr:hypothetical protein [Bacteroidales bacterium]
MPAKPVFIGETKQKKNNSAVTGEYLKIDDEYFYKIGNYNLMPHFFVSIVSNSDHWMFISSNGGITAGRKNRDNALFPYYTDDKIHDSNDITGSKTIILAEKNDKTFLWEPLSQKYQGVYNIKRNIYKNISCNKIIFEEINEDLGLTFSYAWYNSEKYGFIKNSKILNNSDKTVNIKILDGIQNILPYGIQSAQQMQMSTLMDAYKKNELICETGLGFFSLSSVPVDRPEPSEALKATTVWCEGFKESKIILSANQLDDFRGGLEIKQETDIRAIRGAYFVNSEFLLNKKTSKEWNIVADINQGPSEVAALNKILKENKDLRKKLYDDIEEGTKHLVKIVGKADGLQITEDMPITSRHFANVLFNVMRGGIFDDNYNIAKKDFLSFLKVMNKISFNRNDFFLKKLPEKINYSELLKRISLQKDVDLLRLTYEYLPLTFSRRHGDPSRPWNYFSIEIKDDHNNKNLSYQGNWRDIFQNWEALCFSFPEYTESIVCKFLNASTADGYNPYSVTRHGIDWEIHNPHDPWSFIGYWGDHQIIYLLKFLEISENYHPGRLQSFMTNEIFAFSNVPYRIKNYNELLKDPHRTVTYQHEEENVIGKKVNEIGSDGKLILNKNDNVIYANLAEKLLIPVLTKFTNFIPEGGIWMNTQRPEWNDANNALVGYGISMVTLYYMRKYQSYCLGLFKSINEKEISISEEVSELLRNIYHSFEKNKKLLNGKISNKARKSILDELGTAGTNYRNKIYSKSFSGNKKKIKVGDIIKFIELSLSYIDHSIKANKRSDNLYHSYNLMKVENEKEISITHLYEMLEGQTAVLSSGFLSPEESVEVLDAVKKSAMFREDQHSYMLYPDRQLPRFIEKNNIPTSEFKKSKLLKKLIDEGNKKLVEKDINGVVHFNGSFNNAEHIKKSLYELSKEKKYEVLVKKEQELITGIFEKIFNHRAFTGRSGTFYKYEGLGCIYWHMVSKLLLAVEESFFSAFENGADKNMLSSLAGHYYDIREGLGMNKTPEAYGAFPSDPYSHTPGHAGAQQPGMTGQVKEDIISRLGELGIRVHKGIISFVPLLLRKKEFLKKAGELIYFDVTGNKKKISMEAGTLGFTYCQIPIKYVLSNEKKIRIFKKDGSAGKISGHTIDENTSRLIFAKTGNILKIEVWLMPEM